MTASEKPQAESLPKMAMSAVSSSSKAAKTAKKKPGDMSLQKFRIFRCFLCNFPIATLDVREHFSPSLESTGVINYKVLRSPLK